MIRFHAIVACLLCFPAWCADWPQWLGPQRNGKSPETGLLESWPDSGPPLMWRATGLGEGFSSLAVAGGRLYTQGQHDGQQYLTAFDTATGRKLWETPNGRAFRNDQGNGPRSAPTVDGDRVYALASNGRLIAVEAATGRKLWDIDLLDRFDAVNPNRGMTQSPLVDYSRLIVAPGGDGGMVAINKANGEVYWQSGGGDRAGYSSLVVAEVGGLRQYITMTASAAIGVRARDGRLLWRYDRTANIATPIVEGDRVFLSSDYGTGCALLRLDPSGEVHEVYFSRDMRNHYSTSVLVDGYLYGFSSSIFTAMNFETGDVAWRARSVGKGSLISADGLLYVLGEDGTVGLVKADPAEYRELSRFSLEIGRWPAWTLPAIADGRLYLRDQDRLYCYDIRAQ